MDSIQNPRLMSASVPASEPVAIDQLVIPGNATALLAALRKEHEDADDHKGKAARRAMIEAYQIALLALSYDDVWLEICNDPAWEGFKQRPRLKSRHAVLRYAIRLSVGFRGKPDNSIVSTRYRAMAGCFGRGESPDRVRELLEEHGGAEGLCLWERRHPAETGEGKRGTKSKPIRLLLTGRKAQLLLTGALLTDFCLDIVVSKRDGRGVLARARKVRRYLRLPPERK